MSKRWLFVLAIIISLGVAGFFCRSMVTNEVEYSNEPKALAIQVVEAIGSMDIEHAVARFTPPARVKMIDRLDRLYKDYNSIVIQDVYGIIIYEEDIAARVKVSYDMIVTRGKYTATQHCDKIIRLVTYGGVWYVNEPI